MTQPSVTITAVDGALGILPPSGDILPLVLMGPCSGTLTVNTPTGFGRKNAMLAVATGGPLAEAAAYHIERGRNVILVRTETTTDGAFVGTIATSGTGTSAITADSVTEPNDDYDLYVTFITGGTIGTAGATYKWSVDGGRTLSPVTALGTANTIVFPGTGGAAFDFAAGTVLAGTTASMATSAPQWSTSELNTALDALKASVVSWELLEVVGRIDGDAFDALESKFSGMFAAGKPRAWIGSPRMPTTIETEAAYKTAMDAIFASRATTYGELCAGACKLTSAVSGRKYRRPVSFVVASREASVSQEINIADIDLGTLPGVSIVDANGNPDEHDESVNPGLDDSRFTVLRTHEGIQGVYVNRPRVFSADGSDFYILPHRRVFNAAAIALRAYFVRRLSKPVLVDGTTGFILEEEALEIEAGALGAMSAVLGARPKASAWSFALSRTDNLLSTKTLTGDALVVPLAYPETITLTLGFSNPALLVQAA